MALWTRTVTVELKVPETQPVRVDPARSGLVIIDMQNEYCKPGGIFYMHPRRGAVIQPIRELLERCRDAGIPVIYVQSLRDPGSPEFTVFGVTPYILRGSWGSEIVEDLAPLPAEPIVEKNSHDCFSHTRMEQVLAEKGLTPCDSTIFVVGLGLSNCVGCAITGLSVRHYRVVVPMDCTASTTWEQDVVNYQRYLQIGYSLNVTLTESSMIEIAEPSGARAPSRASA